MVSCGLEGLWSIGSQLQILAEETLWIDMIQDGRTLVSVIILADWKQKKIGKFILYEKDRLVGIRLFSQSRIEEV